MDIPLLVGWHKIDILLLLHVNIIRTMFYGHGPELMKLNVCRFIRVMNDGP